MGRQHRAQSGAIEDGIVLFVGRLAGQCAYGVGWRFYVMGLRGPVQPQMRMWRTECGGLPVAVPPPLD
jgi:hypothetical protein